jgi:hypothetical protein
MATLDHYFDDVARTDADAPGGVEEVRGRRYPIGFVANVNKDFITRDLENAAFEDFVAGRGRKVAVVVQKMLIFFGIDGSDRCFKRSGHIILYQGLKLPEVSRCTFSSSQATGRPGF